MASEEQEALSGAESGERVEGDEYAESGLSGQVRQPLPPGAGDRPAVGLVADGSDADRVAGSILRARRHGHDVLVAFERAPTEEALLFARELEATVVDFKRSASATGSDPRQRLTTAAREAGYPGVIVHDRPDRTVDFARSVEALRESPTYAVEAEVESVVRGGSGVLVAIPAYNESRTIADVVAEAGEYADEVVVIDDGSTDETATRADQAGAYVIRHGHNRGYGAALQTAFREAKRARADHLVVLDADGQHDPADVPRLVEAQRESGAEVVIGSRFVAGGETDLPLYRRVGLTVVNGLTNLSLGVVRPSSRVRDTQSGLRVYSGEAVASLAEDRAIGDGMGASTDILQHAHQRNYDIEEVGATVNYRVENGSNHNPVSHGVTLVMNLLRTIEQQRPVTMVGIPGLVITMVGIAFGYWTVALYIQNGVFPLGLAVTSSFFTLAGIFACFTAIILHALNQHFS